MNEEEGEKDEEGEVTPFLPSTKLRSIADQLRGISTKLQIFSVRKLRKEILSVLSNDALW